MKMEIEENQQHNDILTPLVASSSPPEQRHSHDPDAHQASSSAPEAPLLLHSDLDPVVDNGTQLGNFPTKSHLLPFLYTSHFLGRWGDRMWEFAIGLFMIEVWTDSLLLTSLYGLVEAASIAAMGAVIGEWVGRQSRIKVVRVSLGVQNGCVVGAAIALVFLLLHPGSMAGGFSVFVTLVVLVNVLGAISTLAGLATNISVERDWVVVIAAGRSEFLTRMNSVMRRIDLSCKLLAPILVGFIMSYVSVLASAVLIAAWNVVSVGIEYWLLIAVYSEIPELHKNSLSYPQKLDVGIGGKENTVDVGQERQSYPDILFEECPCSMDESMQKPVQNTGGFLRRILRLPFIEGWRVYIQQEMVLGALALAMLYFTVLSFGSLMTAVLKWRGIPAYMLGFARGIAALVGIGATVAYPVMQSHLETVRTGIWSISFQWSLLILCVASVWVHSPKIASGLLMGGVASSRLGLWMFDLSVTQLMQESVIEAERTVIGGVQNSIQSFLQMMSFVVGIIVPRPEDFGKLVLLSFGSVTVSLVLYTIQLYRVRGHLFHLDRIFKSL